MPCLGFRLLLMGAGPATAFRPFWRVGPSPFSRASPSFRGLTHSQKGRSNVNQNCKRTSELEVMSSNDNYKNKARRPTKNREF